MTPEEWPIAAPEAERNPPARAAGRGRLSTVRVDLFLDPAERLTEQERALMTAMLHCLVGDIAAAVRAELPSGWIGVNDGEVELVRALSSGGLLDDPELIALLLRRADEERIGAAARARGGREARVLQGLVSHPSGSVSAAAMALILARGRRRDRFGQCLVSFDDLPQASAERLVHAIAAAMRPDVEVGQGAPAADRRLAAASMSMLARHDCTRSTVSLMGRLVSALEEVDALSDELLLACAQDGEIEFLAEAFGRRADIPGSVALEELVSGSPRRLMALMRVGRSSRALSAGTLASLGDLLGIADPGSAIGVFDQMDPDEVEAAASWLATSPDYRAALEILGNRRG